MGERCDQGERFETRSEEGCESLEDELTHQTWLVSAYKQFPDKVGQLGWTCMPLVLGIDLDVKEKLMEFAREVEKKQRVFG